MLRLFVLIGVLLCNLLASEIQWDGTDEGKNTYTRAIYTKHQKNIEQVVSELGSPPMHPMYQMLTWLYVTTTGFVWNTPSVHPISGKPYEQSLIRTPFETWLVSHLLNTAGHWGWSQNKSVVATPYETKIYYEVGLSEFLLEPKTILLPTAPDYLKHIQSDADTMRSIKPDTGWNMYWRWRRQKWMDTKHKYLAKDGDLYNSMFQYFRESIEWSVKSYGHEDDHIYMLSLHNIIWEKGVEIIKQEHINNVAQRANLKSSDFEDSKRNELLDLVTKEFINYRTYDFVFLTSDAVVRTMGDSICIQTPTGIMKGKRIKCTVKTEDGRSVNLDISALDTPQIIYKKLLEFTEVESVYPEFLERMIFGKSKV